ncbi:DUF257 family protein [Thermococcus sp.]|uniref:DUF257 family protein n=1 Tax=Thermococcus sp. TaxID=35749 RepID=UPI0026341CF0|nr:DUF257 family protein [Thermococcus sp.]
MEDTLEKLLLGEALRGDVVIIEYSSLTPVERTAWGKLVPLLKANGNLVITDFFGIGDTLFRKYLRRLPGKAYSEFVELIKDIKVIKIGPGATTYGEILDEMVPTYDPHIFLKNYHAIMSRISRLPQKPKFLLSFGLSHYARFNPDGALKSIITAVTNIPMEDLIGVHLVNKDILTRENLAVFEEIATFVLDVSDTQVLILKDGGVGD